MKVLHLLIAMILVSSCNYKKIKTKDEKEVNVNKEVLDSCVRQLKVLEESFEMCMSLHNEKYGCDCDENGGEICQN
jgi:hypothetical protein